MHGKKLLNYTTGGGTAAEVSGSRSRRRRRRPSRPGNWKDGGNGMALGSRWGRGSLGTLELGQARACMYIGSSIQSFWCSCVDQGSASSGGVSQSLPKVQVGGELAIHLDGAFDQMLFKARARTPRAREVTLPPVRVQCYILLGSSYCSLTTYTCHLMTTIAQVCKQALQ